jgi:hypothetical protein
MCNYDCSSNYTAEQWGVYSTFFTHVESMCFYIISLAWQSTTSNLINVLSTTSELVSLQLLNNTKVLEGIDTTHGVILTKLNMTMQIADQTSSNIKENLHTMKEMEKTINSSFKEVLQGMMMNANNISSVLESIYKRVKQVLDVEHWIFDEFLDIKCVMFYIMISMFTYILTSFEQTKRRRYSIFGLIIGCLYSEKLLASYALVSPNELMWVRLLFGILGAFILVDAIRSYKDMNEINYALLKELDRSMQSVRKKVARPSFIIQKLKEMMPLIPDPLLSDTKESLNSSVCK